MTEKARKLNEQTDDLVKIIDIKESLSQKAN